MFFRIARKAFTHRRSRVAVALLSLTVGAAVAAAMLSVYYDAGRKMSRELRTYGANVMLSPAAGNDFISQATMDQITKTSWDAEVEGAAPFLYIVAMEGPVSDPSRVVVVGTWPDAARKLSPWWKVDGNWISDMSDQSHCIVGARLAKQFGIAVGQRISLSYGAVAAGGSTESAAAALPGSPAAAAGPQNSASRNSSTFDVAGILTTGGAEEDQILVSLAAAQKLSGLNDRLSAVAISAVGDTHQIELLAGEMNSRLNGVRADLVRQIAEGEGRVLNKLRLTMLSITLLMLAAASLSVTTTLASLIMERRKEIGVMKAIGANETGLLRLFLFELALLGVGGGILGYLAGLLAAQPIGRSLFGVGVAPRIGVLAIVMGISLLIALLSGLVPIRRIREIRPALILSGN